jgi:putative cardiolipin synthase
MPFVRNESASPFYDQQGLQRRARGWSPAGRWLRLFAALLTAAAAGCASLPPGHDFPKTQSVAYEHPEATRLGRLLEAGVAAHPGNSGYRLLPAGVDGFVSRVQMIDAAERSIDMQYYIFRQDETGRLLTDAVLRAADRGVKVRILTDDGETVKGDGRLAALDAHALIEVRVFNPFAYRGNALFPRALEFALNKPRLDYRMHNKLFVVDNEIALVGGRNLGDQYFQVDPESQFGDDDVFAAGPMVRRLSAVFDEFWNSDLAIPVEALDGKPPVDELDKFRRELAANRKEKKQDGVSYETRVATGEPLAGLLGGGLPLSWSRAELVYDSPEKRKVVNGRETGMLIEEPVVAAAADTQKELLIVSPFFIPGKSGMDLFAALRDRGVRVSILTNSLESTPEPAAQSGYMRYRVPLLQDGVQLYEVRALLGNTKGSGETHMIAQYGNYALHAKLFVFDRKRVFIGSMNFDQRSAKLNTEIGLLIDSPELAQQTAARFEAMTQPANCYSVALAAGGSPQLLWRTAENGKAVEYAVEPARDERQRFHVRLLSLLPLDQEL